MKPEPKIRFVLEILWLRSGRLSLSFNHTGTWEVMIRPGWTSQTWVFSSCALNQKCTLPFRLEKAKIPIMLLFVKFKAIMCINLWCGDRKNSFYCDPHASIWKIFVCPNLKRDYWKPADKTGTPYLYIVGWQCLAPTRSTQGRHLGLLFSCALWFDTRLRSCCKKCSISPMVYAGWWRDNNIKGHNRYCTWAGVFMQVYS